MEPEPVASKRGRKPRIKAEDFAKRRDDLVHFIELRWPYLCARFHKRASIRSLLRAIEAASPGAQAVWAYRHLSEHVATLQAFMRSGRYQGEPRQLAYAIAGLPELAWRTSFDYGTKHPSSLHINLAAFSDHIRRNKPECFKKVNGEGVTNESLRMLKTCCNECHGLASQLNRLEKALKVGQGISTSA